MVKNDRKYERVLECAVHIIGWGLFFLVPLFFNTDKENLQFNLWHYLKFSVVPLTFCALFYLNYFVYVPRYLYGNRQSLFFFVNILTIAGLWIAMQLWNMAVLPEPPVGPPRAADGPEMSKPFALMFIRDIFSMILVAGLAAALRLGKQINEMENARKEVEMANLKSQINPHFLLNTLNNIFALISFDTAKAQKAVLELSRLLRYALYEIRENTVPLHKEVDFIRSYIALMELRVPDNVSVVTDIDIDPESSTPVAPLLFISLIENAFKHGISPSGKNYINIRLKETPSEIQCLIRNSSHPKNSRDKSGSGIGLTQVKKRLDIMYEGKYFWDKGEDPDRQEYHSYLILKK